MTQGQLDLAKGTAKWPWFVVLLFLAVMGFAIRLYRENANPITAPPVTVPWVQTDSVPHPDEDPGPVKKTGVPVVSALDLRQMSLLSEILAARNDNDPRLDSEFKDLSPAARGLMREKYLTLPLERRNDRGTIVYLLGKKLQKAEDSLFLRSVLSEPPCLGMENCARETPSGTGPSGVGPNGTGLDEHENVGFAVSLAYPQMVALIAIDQALTAAEASGELLPGIGELKAALERTCASTVSPVSERACPLLERLKKLSR